MSDSYPKATPAYPAPAAPSTQAAATPLVLTADEQAEVDAMYDKLKPEATATARDYVLARTPPKYQEAMTAKIDADWPVPPV